MKRTNLIPALLFSVPMLASASPVPVASPVPEAASAPETQAAANAGGQVGAPAETAMPAVDGRAVFQQRCQTCHAVEEGQYSPIGPNLAGIVGRQAGAAEFRYSPALRGSGITWTPDQLDKYVAAPTATVPGTRMSIGLADDALRAAVIAYLATTGQ